MWIPINVTYVNSILKQIDDEISDTFTKICKLRPEFLAVFSHQI